ncbi:MAG: virulence-associated E family protein, partial [Saccharofermentanales bacterium]
TLPEWDGKTRAETILIDYLGAADNAYTRAVTRKTLCGAVARIKQPGIKFDHILVLNGDQGIGKSTLIERLGGAWYSDSLTLTDMNDKTAAEKLQGYWILEIGELAGMKKADIDKVKAFISRQDDKYRASFGRRVTPHPRQCIFFGTTNSQNGYLRDITGNRRFWTVKTPGTGKMKPWELSKEEVRQIWAEVLLLVQKGEKLYLDSDLEAFSQVEQSAAMEQDDREGLVRTYLDLLLPENWTEMDTFARHEYVCDPNGLTHPKGTVRRNTVTNLEIWCECFGKRKEDIKPADSYALAAIMLHIEGWQKTEERKMQPIYGQQRLYKRL